MDTYTALATYVRHITIEPSFFSPTLTRDNYDTMLETLAGPGSLKPYRSMPHLKCIMLFTNLRSSTMRVVCPRDIVYSSTMTSLACLRPEKRERNTFVTFLCPGNKGGFRKGFGSVALNGRALGCRLIALASDNRGRTTS